MKKVMMTVIFCQIYHYPFSFVWTSSIYRELGEKTMKVSLFMTCLGEMFTPKVGIDVVEILERLGCEVDLPQAQTCCGQVAYNGGYREDAIKGAKQTIKAFEMSEYVVTPSGSCAG